MFRCRFVFSLPVCLLLCLLVSTPLQGEKTLRWQLEPDQKYRLLAEWTTRAVTDEVEVTNTTECELLWVVKAVGLSGDHEISQSLTHVKQTLQTPDGALFQYDSRAAGETKGTTAFLAAYWKPLLGSERNFTMTPRGEVIRDNEDSQATAEENEFVSLSFGREAWRNAFQGGNVVFPAGAVQDQQVWTESQTLPLADEVAKLMVTRSYTYGGEQEQEEAADAPQSLDVIRIANRFEIQSEEGQTSTLSIMQQDGVGEILFNTDQGHLVTSSLDQSLGLRYIMEGRELTSRINTAYKISFRLLPKSDDSATEATPTETTSTDLTPAETTPAETTPAETTTAGNATSP